MDKRIIAAAVISIISTRAESAGPPERIREPIPYSRTQCEEIVERYTDILDLQYSYAIACEAGNKSKCSDVERVGAYEAEMANRANVCAGEYGIYGWYSERFRAHIMIQLKMGDFSSFMPTNFYAAHYEPRLEKCYGNIEYVKGTYSAQYKAGI